MMGPSKSRDVYGGWAGVLYAQFRLGQNRNLRLWKDGTNVFQAALNQSNLRVPRLHYGPLKGRDVK
jgi:hypothetical protein